jgi:hypothetical protein
MRVSTVIDRLALAGVVLAATVWIPTGRAFAQG